MKTISKDKNCHNIVQNTNLIPDHPQKQTLDLTENMSGCPSVLNVHLAITIGSHHHYKDSTNLKKNVK